MTATPPPLLDVRDLAVRYADGTEALRGVSLSLGPGQRLAVLGPNGSGKTSLLLALLRAVPFTGQIVVAGVPSQSRTVRQIRRCCGMVFQDADDQLFMPTLLEDVAFGPLNQGQTPEAAADRAAAALAAVGLEGLGARPAHHLSGGQKRCAALATGLAMDVRLLLLDEPAANLDARCRRRLTELLARRPEAMIVATHDLDIARGLCTRAILLEEGRVVADAPAAEMLADTALLTRHGVA